MILRASFHQDWIAFFLQFDKSNSRDGYAGRKLHSSTSETPVTFPSVTVELNVMNGMIVAVGCELDPLVQYKHDNRQRENDQETSLNKLHIRRGCHSRGGYDKNDDGPDQDDADPVREPQQRSHQSAGTHHLRNQIEYRHNESADGRSQFDRRRIEFGIEGVGKRIFAHPPQRLRHQE